MTLREYFAKAAWRVGVYWDNRLWANMLNNALQRFCVSVTARMNIFDRLTMLLDPTTKTLDVWLIPIAIPY